MTPEEAIVLLGPTGPKEPGPITLVDVLFAVEAWICARVARAESVQRFIEGGSVPRLVYTRDE